MELFSVMTVTKAYRGYKDVTFTWFRHKVRRPYAQLIQEYEPGNKDFSYAEGCIDELFTAAEAAALKSYLDREHGDHSVTTIEPVGLPVAKSAMGIGALPVGGLDDFLMLDREESYSLPFSVWGFSALSHCELIDSSGTAEMVADLEEFPF